MNSIIISLLCSVLFGIIDSLFFLLGEDKLQLILLKIHYFDMNTAEIISGGVSSALALFVSIWVGKILSKKYKISVSPLLHCIGILLGSICIALIYVIVSKATSKNIKRKRVRFST
jgi:hypothetical protein